MSKNDDTLIKDIRQVLEHSLDDLDAGTSFRLTQARQQAMEASRPERSRLLYWFSAPVAGLILVVLLLNWPTAPVQPGFAPEFNELSILTAVEPLEFYQEEIEFYEWLSEVLETDNELSEHDSIHSDTSGADRIVGAGEPFIAIAEPGNA